MISNMSRLKKELKIWEEKFMKQRSTEERQFLKGERNRNKVSRCDSLDICDAYAEETHNGRFVCLAKKGRCM